jgi:tetratricopeptide (TPR) repeat protein
MPVPARAARLVAFGHTCKIRGDLELANELFREAAEASPASGMERGDVLAGQGRWRQAADTYAAVVKANPANYTVRCLWSLALGQLEDSTAAQQQLLLANLQVLIPEKRYELAKALEKSDLKSVIRPEVVRQLELVERTALPDSRISVTAGQEIGNIISTEEPLRSAGYWQRLLLHMLNSSALFQQPEGYPLLSHVIHIATARAATVAGDKDMAAKEMARCEAMLPANISTVLKLTPRLRAAGMDDSAGELLEHALRVHQDVLDSFPRSAMYWNNAAWLCARTQRRLGDALAWAEKAVEVAPDEAAYQDTLAEVHFQRGDREAAVAAAQKCLELAPDNQMFATRLKHFREDALKTLDGTEE